jgi:hypothetical protein
LVAEACYLSLAQRLSAAGAPVPSAVALTFLAVAVLVLACVAKLTAHPTIAAVVTFFAVATSIIDFHAAWAEPEALREARRILENQATEGHSHEEHLAHCGIHIP